MLTLDNHLTGVTADRPHPQSYRPDLPLRSEYGEELERAEALANEFQRGNEEGYEEGYGEGEKAAKQRYLGEVSEANARVTELRDRLATIGAAEK